MYTDKNYWQNYYHNINVDKNQIISICSKYDKYWDILFKACKHDPKSILEVGAYPGRFIAYVASKYQLKPTALDFIPDSTKIERSFKEMGVSDYEIITDDINSHIPGRKYDLIISLGFIEHFEDYKSVLNKHADMLEDGGAILIIIPNKRGLRKLYGFLCDKKNLEAHNLKCMNKKTFKEFSINNNLKVHLLTYYGSFQYGVHQKLNYFQLFIYHFVRLLSIKFKPYIEKYPSWIYSAGIIAIYSKE